jgi:hypothetical protein
LATRAVTPEREVAARVVFLIADGTDNMIALMIANAFPRLKESDQSADQ